MGPTEDIRFTKIRISEKLEHIGEFSGYLELHYRIICRRMVKTLLKRYFADYK